MESKRQQKFGRQIQKDLSDIFQKEFKEIFGKAMVTITDVKMSPDLSAARCYLSFLLVHLFGSPLFLFCRFFKVNCGFRM